MELLYVSDAGARFAATWFLVAPTVGTVGYVLARWRGWLVPRPTRFQSVGLVLAGAVYVGLIWSWLFGGQFYRVHADGDRWRLVYLMPERSTYVEVADVVEVAAVPGPKLAHRVQIRTRSGLVLDSGQLGRVAADAGAKALRDALLAHSTEPR